jgi:hypothetical protein
MIECTFINDDDIKQADIRFHMHWNYLKDYIINHQNNKFILYRFSKKYKKSEITDFFEKINYANVIP